MTSTEQRTLTGAAGGAAGGALIGAIAGDAGLVALIGAGGFSFGRSKQNEQRAYRQGYDQGQSQRSRY
jgi:hypothetical protein